MLAMALKKGSASARPSLYGSLFTHGSNNWVFRGPGSVLGIRNRTITETDDKQRSF